MQPGRPAGQFGATCQLVDKSSSLIAIEPRPVPWGGAARADAADAANAEPSGAKVSFAGLRMIDRPLKADLGRRHSSRRTGRAILLFGPLSGPRPAQSRFRLSLSRPNAADAN